MKKVYICARYKGNVFRNIALAQEYSRWVYKQGYLPICVHLFLNESTGLSEENGDRKKLLKLGLEILEMCDECWVFDESGISEGMEAEIRRAVKKDIKVRVLNKIETFINVDEVIIE